jgi:pyruvyltransferase
MRKLIKQIQYNLQKFYYGKGNVIFVDWVSGLNNFGDVLNPIILEGLTGKKVKSINSQYANTEYFSVIGSILDRANHKTIIWGSGFISGNSKVNRTPLKVCAVRGPKSRKLLISNGIKCPEIYGDPALLLPFMYHPMVKKKYKLGIVPHYVDKKDEFLLNFFNNDEVKILNIQEDPYSFVKHILSCEFIISSSLHGVIVSDAYRIPSLWCDFSNKVVGDGFKFLDYFESVGRTDVEPIKIKRYTQINEILSFFYDYKINIDLIKLIESCPIPVCPKIKSKVHNKSWE